MSDNLRQYRAIRKALTQGYPGKTTGHVARRLTTLAALISGIVASKSTQLPKSRRTCPRAPSRRAASNALPDGSRTTRF